ncbi:hypothetical protein ACJX0J_006138, partial [Zea mays]
IHSEHAIEIRLTQLYRHQNYRLTIGVGFQFVYLVFVTRLCCCNIFIQKENLDMSFTDACLCLLFFLHLHLHEKKLHHPIPIQHLCNWETTLRLLSSWDSWHCVAFELISVGTLLLHATWNGLHIVFQRFRKILHSLLVYALRKTNMTIFFIWNNTSENIHFEVMFIFMFNEQLMTFLNATSYKL